MTQNRRIILNVLATYGRSVLALFCGLFTSRWVLSALGVKAYGVYGVVGIIVSLVSVANAILSSSLSRYYAVAVGKACGNANDEVVIEECKAWFNIAFLIHFTLPLLLVLGTFFVGEWAIDKYFNIPIEYIRTSHWVFYFALITTWVSFLVTPFTAFYIAHQKIAELTLYGILVPVVNLFCAWILLSYGGDRLFFHAFYTMVLAITPSIAIMCRSFFVFPACRLDIRKMFNGKRFKKLFSFAGWQTVGWLGLTARGQCSELIVNRLLGIEYNATMGIGNTVSGHASHLSESLSGAFTPAIANATGADNRADVYKLSLKCSKFGTLLCAIFILPLAVEIDYIIAMWLKTVPPNAGIVCLYMLMIALTDRLGRGPLAAILASGKIRNHEIYCTSCHLLSIVLAYIFIRFMGWRIVGVCNALLVSVILITFMRIWLWRTQLAFPVRELIFSVGIPSVLACLAGLAAGYIWRFIFSASLLRCGLSVVTTLCAYLPVCYYLVLSVDERIYVVNKLRRWFS